MTITGNFELFQHFNFETGFLKNGVLFKKTRVPLLVGSTEIENATVPNQAALSEVNAKKNRVRSRKWTYLK